MIQAAVEGCVDYKEARPTDPRWLMRHALLLAGLEAKNSRTLYNLEMQNHLGITLVPNISEEDYKKHRQAAWACYREIQYNLRPHLRPTDVTPVRDARNSWVSEWGDPGDPAVQAKIDAVADSILKRARARRQASESSIRTVRLPKRRV